MRVIDGERRLRSGAVGSSVTATGRSARAAGHGEATATRAALPALVSGGVRRALGSAVKGASLVADRVHPPAPGITVLIFHRVGARTDSVVDLPTARFTDMLAWLRDHHRVVSLTQAVDELSATAPSATASATTVEPGVVLTFDDGTADTADTVIPLLDDFRIPATLYLATGFVDGMLRWPDGAAPLSRAGLAEIAASPWMDVGSHTHQHLLLDRLPPGQVAPELDRSIELIGEWTGTAPAHFAYPKAVAPSSHADQEVRRRFRSAALATPGANRPGQDLHALRRTAVQRTDGPRCFAAKARGGMAFEAVLRERVNRVRYRGATS
jgi:peptidoglycan/xylan/chitin deacetylase (PgdA/CDA1 family)